MVAVHFVWLCGLVVVLCRHLMQINQSWLYYLSYLIYSFFIRRSKIQLQYLIFFQIMLVVVVVLGTCSLFFKMMQILQWRQRKKLMGEYWKYHTQIRNQNTRNGKEVITGFYLAIFVILSLEEHGLSLLKVMVKTWSKMNRVQFNQLNLNTGN